MWIITATILILSTVTSPQEADPEDALPEVDLFEIAPPETLLLYADLPEIKIRSEVTIGGKTKISKLPDNYVFKFEWSKAKESDPKDCPKFKRDCPPGSESEGDCPPDYREYDEGVDRGTRRFVGHVDGALAAADYCFRVVARPTAIASRDSPSFRSKPVRVRITKDYALSVAPPSARPGDVVEISVSPPPTLYTLKTAKVSFGSLASVRTGTETAAGFEVFVPDTLASGSWDVRVEMGDPDSTTITSVFHGFAVQGPQAQSAPGSIWLVSTWLVNSAVALEILVAIAFVLLPPLSELRRAQQRKVSEPIAQGVPPGVDAGHENKKEASGGAGNQPSAAGREELDSGSQITTPTGAAFGASPPLQLFFSYSQRDAELRDELEVALASLKRENLVSLWHDGKIVAGETREKAIDHWSRCHPSSRERLFHRFGLLLGHRNEASG
jgi:hypothetical protein